MEQGGTRIGRGFVGFIIARPWLSIVLGLGLLAAMVPGLRSLRTQFTYRAWFAPTDPLIERFDAFERRFGNDDSALVLVRSPSGLFDVETATLLRELTNRLWTVPEVIRVDSLANFNWVHAEEDDLIVEPLIPDEGPLDAETLAARRAVALAHPLIPGYLTGPEARTAAIYVRLKPALDSVPDFPKVIDGIEKVLAEFEGQGDHEFFITGTPMVADSFRDAARNDARRLLPAVFGLIIICLAIAMRRASAVLLPLLIIVLAIAGTLGTAGWFDLPINNLTASVPQFLVAISIATGVHVFNTFNQAYADGADRLEAVRVALRSNMQPTLMTSVTTAVGFLSFSGAVVIPVRHLGILSGLGTMLAWLLTYLVAGGALTLLPLKRKARVLKDRTRGGRIAETINRMKAAILFGYAALCVVAVAAATMLVVDSDYFEYFAEDAPVHIATQRVEADVGGALIVELVIDSGKPGGAKEPEFLREVDRLADWLRARPFITSAVSVVDFLKATNKALHGDDQKAYVLPDSRDAVAQEFLLYTMSLPQGMDLNDRMSLDEDAVRLTTVWRPHNSRTVLPELEIIQAEAARLGLKLTFTGKSLLLLQMNPYVVDAFVQSLLIALITVSLILMAILRSVRLGLLAMIPNAVPLLFGAAMLATFSRPLDIGTVVVFSICLGIAVDDTVHFLAHYNVHRHAGLSPEQAVARIYDRTMPAMVATTVTVVIAFGIFAYSSFVPNRLFGILTSFILSTALITDALLLPALLLLRDRRALAKDGS
ncbi:MAG: MMPL family transporter [Myxococcales bacterium]|nr:MMPL family transporter [Myxococcales bacterium]